MARYLPSIEECGHTAFSLMSTPDFSFEVKLPERELWHSPPSGAEVKNEWNCTSFLPTPSSHCAYLTTEDILSLL